MKKYDDANDSVLRNELFASSVIPKSFADPNVNRQDN